MIIIKNISGQSLGIRPINVLAQVKLQFLRNPKLKKWFNDLLKEKGNTINDILYGKIRVEVNIFHRSSCFFQSQGQTRWAGVFRGGWKGQRNRTIGLGSCAFTADWFDTDTSDEKDAAELLIHELSHWVEAYSIGEIWSGRPKKMGYDTGDYVVKVLVR